MPQAKRRFKRWVLDNGSYKLIALFVTVILWVTILGRRDFILTRDMKIDFLVPPNFTVQEAPEQVQVRVSGPRIALRKFTQSSGIIVLDLVRFPEGKRTVGIPPESVDLPFGVKLLSISPSRVTLKLAKVESSPDAQK